MGRFLVCVLQRGDAERETHGPELRRPQRFLQLHKMISRNRHDRGILLPATGKATRVRDRERVRAVGETAFRLDLQKAADIRLGQLGHFRLQHQRPPQRNADGAAALANAGLLQMIADLASDQFRIAGQRVQCERGGEALLHAQRTVGPPQHHAFEPAAGQRQTQNGRRSAFGS